MKHKHGRSSKALPYIFVREQRRQDLSLPDHLGLAPGTPPPQDGRRRCASEVMRRPARAEGDAAHGDTVAPLPFASAVRKQRRVDVEVQPYAPWARAHKEADGPLEGDTQLVGQMALPPFGPLLQRSEDHAAALAERLRRGEAQSADEAGGLRWAELA
eukprot:11229568-Alexandrium_andersonii.AAC.1